MQEVSNLSSEFSGFNIYKFSVCLFRKYFLSKYFFILQFHIDEKNELIEFKNINMLMLREQGRRLSVGYAGSIFRILLFEHVSFLSNV